MSKAAERALSLVDLLTNDEIETLRCMVAGESQKAIAFRLGMNEEAALDVRQSLMNKLGASSAADVVREGINAGL